MSAGTARFRYPAVTRGAVVLQFDRPDLKATASPELLARGCVHVIGLEALRDKAGPLWEKIRAGIHSRLDAILRQRLGPADFFVVVDDVFYLVTMPTASTEDAQVACLGAAYELYTSYFGQCDLAMVNLYRAVQAPANAIGTERIPAEQLSILAERAGATNGMGKARTEATRIESTRVSGASESSLADAKVQFQPVWDARNEAITLYRCVPQPIVVRQGSSPIALDDLAPKARAKVELSCLHHGIATLARHIERGERFLMAFGVAYETLSSHVTRVEFTNACRELSSNFRQYMVMQLTDVPAGVPHSRLSDLVMTLRPFARAVMSEVPSACRSYAAYEDIGLQAIGMNLERARLVPREASDEIAKLTTAAKRLSVSAFLWGVDNEATLRSARHGVHFMTGSAIAPVVSAPRPMTRLYWHEVLQTESHSTIASRG
jgi:hypothetical protein